MTIWMLHRTHWATFVKNIMFTFTYFPKDYSKNCFHAWTFLPTSFETKNVPYRTSIYNLYNWYIDLDDFEMHWNFSILSCKKILFVRGNNIKNCQYFLISIHSYNFWCLIGVYSKCSHFEHCTENKVYRNKRKLLY